MAGTSIAVAAASALLVGLLAWRIRGLFRPGPSVLDEPAVFFLLVSLCVFVVRLPRILWAGELNVDESQMLAQAMRYLTHPVPWRDVDGTTGGPLDSMLLSAPMLLGARAAWLTARIVLWAANCLTLILLYRTLRSFGTRSECQLLLTPALFFYAFAVNANFAHYSSETLSCLLLSACLCLLSVEWQSRRPARVRLLLLGLCAGSVPFAKLQAGPVAMFLAAVGLVLVTVRRRDAPRTGRARWTDSAALCLGVALVPTLILGVVAAGGAFGDFWNSYILASVDYAGQGGLPRKVKNVWYLFSALSDFRYFALGIAALSAVSWGALRAARRRVEDRLRWPLIVILAQCVLTLVCIATAGKSFLHYALLLLPPLAVLAGLAGLAARATLLPERQTGPDRAPVAARRLFATFVAVMSLQAVMPVRYLHAVETRVLPRGPAPVSTVAQLILAVREPGDELSVWGWVPSYHVETGLMPATRDAVGHFVVSPGPYQDYFRKRYLRDLERSRPAFFVDAVASGMFGWGWTNRDTHESFPELADFIGRNYQLWRSVSDFPAGSPVRIYVLRSRAAGLRLGAGGLKSTGR